jgi:hypothetical protein
MIECQLFQVGVLLILEHKPLSLFSETKFIFQEVTGAA